ncbi:MAG: 30S ribosome-binding factor RbfA [Bacteroidota bacterium]
MSVRTEKVASLFKEELGNYFQKNFPLERYGLMTVTEVRMSPDLRNAKVFVSIFGDGERKKKSLAQLESHKPEIRSAMGKLIRLRYTPALLFVLDESIDRAMNLEKIFKQIHQERDEQGSENSGSER